MPTNPKVRNSPKAPQDMNEAEFRALELSISEALRSAKSIADRRNLVMVLDGRGLRRSEIAKVICEPFGISIKTLDEDLRWVRDYWVDYARNLKTDDAKAQVLKTNAEITRRAMAQGDLSNANRANEHLATIARLTDPNHQADPNATPLDPEQQRARLIALLLPDGKKGGKG